MIRHVVIALRLDGVWYVRIGDRIGIDPDPIVALRIAFGGSNDPFGCGDHS